MTGRYGRDLVVLVAHRNTEFALRGLLDRRRSLRIREVSADVFGHPSQDTGCLREAHDFLRPFVTKYAHALVMFDHDGSGREAYSRQALEEEVERRLSQCGWGSPPPPGVVGPAIETGVWSDSPEVESVLGWAGRSPELRAWLVQQGFLEHAQQAKPARPKEALEEALRVSSKPRSSALYLQLAKKVGLQRCTDEAFGKLKTLLQTWFPEPPL